MNEGKGTSPSTPALQVFAMFEQVKIKRVGAMVVVFDLVVGGIFFEILPLETARWAHLGVLLLAICYAAWVCKSDRDYYVRYRNNIIAQLAPGWYRVGVDGWVKRALLDDGVEASGEREMVSLSDQGGVVAWLVAAADGVIYLLMFGLTLIMQSSSQVGYFEVRLAIWSLFLVILLRWAIWGNGLFSGINRLAVDPEGWEWGGWSRRFKKSGRWVDARVIVKPMTKWGRDRYFVVIGDENGSVGMIVPRGSVELIERATLVTSSDGSNLSPAS